MKPGPVTPHLSSVMRPGIDSARPPELSLLSGSCTQPTRRLFACMLLGLLTLALIGCRDRNGSTAAPQWDRIVDGQSNDLYFIDRNSIQRTSDTAVRVSIKYSPSKGRFLTSLQELSKDFGSTAHDIGQEYSVSTWEFSCVKKEARCLNLTHYKKGSKIASYDYPQPVWRALDSAPNTKLLRDLVCARISSPSNSP